MSCVGHKLKMDFIRTRWSFILNNHKMFWSSEIFNLQDELSENGSGTVVIRSPKGSKPSVFRDQSSQVAFKLSYSDKKLIFHLCSHLLRILMQCSPAAVMLLSMILWVEPLFCVANMMILILHGLQGPD